MSDDLGPCAWCGEPAVTRVIVVPGRKNRKTTPVCEAHAADFEARGVATTRSKQAEKQERERKRSQWKVRRVWP